MSALMVKPRSFARRPVDDAVTSAFGTSGAPLDDFERHERQSVFPHRSQHGSMRARDAGSARLAGEPVVEGERTVSTRPPLRSRASRTTAPAARLAEKRRRAQPRPAPTTTTGAPAGCACVNRTAGATAEQLEKFAPAHEEFGIRN
jgi:hypothetical protein